MPDAVKPAESKISDKVVVSTVSKDVYLCEDGVARKVDGKVAVAEDVPVADLPAKHQFEGLRLVKVVPCGMPDCVIGKDGRLVPAGVAETIEGELPKSEETTREK